MHQQSRLLALLPLLAAIALGLAACTGGYSQGLTAPMSQASMNQTGQMTLAVADTRPADDAAHVVLVFTGVELTGINGNPVTIIFSSPKRVDLMTQTGTPSAVLFDQPIPSGSYDQIRLMVKADGSANNSYIDFADGSRFGLRLPSDSETGITLLTRFAVSSSGVVGYTVDFDLRKAIACRPGEAPACILKPAERLVDNTSLGNIQGQIKSALPAGCTPGVYLYSGIVTEPQDMNSTAVAIANQPLASKVPIATSAPPYYYQFPLLPPGTYTVAFTCQAALDNPDRADPAVILTPVVTTAVTGTADIRLGGNRG